MKIIIIALALFMGVIETPAFFQTPAAFDLSSGELRLLREFHKLMQREGQEIK